MPLAEQLPEELKELAYRNAVELTHARWESDVQVLIKGLSGDVGGLPRGASAIKAGLSAASSGMGGTGPAASTQPVRKSRSAIFAALMVAMLVTAGIVAAYILLSSRIGRKPSAVERRLRRRHERRPAIRVPFRSGPKSKREREPIGRFRIRFWRYNSIGRQKENFHFAFLYV